MFICTFINTNHIFPSAVLYTMLTVSALGVAFVLVVILLSLTIQLNTCSTLIMNPYCDNASLLKLSCESVFINNVNSLTFTVVCHCFPQYSDYRKFCSILFHIIPGSLNPIIYEVQSKAIQRFLAKFFKPKKMLKMRTISKDHM